MYYNIILYYLLQVTYDQKSMRGHLHECLCLGEFSVFPRIEAEETTRRTKPRTMTLTVSVYQIIFVNLCNDATSRISLLLAFGFEFGDHTSFFWSICTKTMLISL